MHAWRAPLPWLLASVHWRSVQGDCLAWCRLNFEINCRGSSSHCSTCGFCLGEPPSPPSLSKTPTSAPPKAAPPKAAPPNSAWTNSLQQISPPASASPPPFPPTVTHTLLLHAQSNASSVPTIVVANLSNASSVSPMKGSWRTHTGISSLPGRPNLSVSFGIESKWIVLAFAATALVGLVMMTVGYRFRDREATLLKRFKRRIRSVTGAGRSTLLGLSGRFEWGMPVDTASGFGLHDEEESNDIHVNGKKTSPTRCAARLPTARTGKRIVRPAHPKHGSKLKQTSQRIGLLEREHDIQDDLDEAQLEQGRSLAAAYLDPSLLKEIGH